ncbi:PAS domain S-box protein [Acinetobacter chinensis]|jgi:PAS domain S-box-containing protein|uniref:HTH-type transcriptional regulatory protein TyrR n=1 Tax=Acinetobacter chinensis TaxID=2004650 RepID=A0A3B7LTV6_9GAMM|nr:MULTISPECIES: sigma 54-interacting transcriptional regulator [Acinetobacter]AXY56290.1 PAS domain S-box protein [Acinetobacter chinensis]AXY59679.1 PAS domain S-box protein [Acinetobacter sp. WCHAc010052]WOE42695.1 sigma 54-interacting transcriptional regulator [Acinetobacter chinensis]
MQQLSTDSVQELGQKLIRFCKSDDAFVSEPVNSILEAIQDGLYITDKNAITVTVNKAYERITGLDRKLLIGRSMDEIVTQGYLTNSISADVLRKKEVVTTVQTINQNQKILVTGSPLFDEQGNVSYIISSVRDVTELVAAKHAQEQLENLYKTKSQHKVQCSDTDFIISRQSQAVFDQATHIAQFDCKVLIQGETGTGKSKLARYIHSCSPRASEVFMELNCSGIPENLLEIELFGYVAGAFTGASAKGKKGLLEIAHKGTLFLDEIGDLPLPLQVKILKVIEEQRFIPVGATEYKTIDIRVISATHKHLKTQISKGEFREDLYYRLNVVELELAPLRERRTEIIPLIQFYKNHVNQKYGLNTEIELEVLEFLSCWNWPGNIRELINLVERLLVSSTDRMITLNHLPKEFTEFGLKKAVSTSLKDRMVAYEKSLIIEAMSKFSSMRQAAMALGVDQSTLVKKIARYKHEP